MSQVARRGVAVRSWYLHPELHPLIGLPITTRAADVHLTSQLQKVTELVAIDPLEQKFALLPEGDAGQTETKGCRNLIAGQECAVMGKLALSVTTESSD